MRPFSFTSEKQRHRNQLHNFILMLQMADKEFEVQIQIQAPKLQHTLLSLELKEQVVTTLAI